MVRIREYRQAKGMTMKELGEAIGVTESAIGQYENGRRKPDYEKLLLIGQVLGCSIDDLVVGEDDHAAFARSLTKRRTDAGLSIPEFSERLSAFLGTTIRASSVRGWETGNLKLSESGMRKVADFFNVPFESMLQKEISVTVPEQDFPEITLIARAGQKMTPEQRELMLKWARLTFPDAFEDKQ